MSGIRLGALTWVLQSPPQESAMTGLLGPNIRGPAPHTRFVMPLESGGASASGPRADVGLLDAPASDIGLCERPAVAVAPVHAKGDLVSGHHGLETALCRRAARLVKLGRIYVRQAELLPVAHERVAVNRQASLAGTGGACRKQQGTDEYAHAFTTQRGLFRRHRMLWR